MDSSTNLICKLNYLKVLFIYYIMEENDEPILSDDEDDVLEVQEETEDLEDQDDQVDLDDQGDQGDLEEQGDLEDEELGITFPGDAEAITPDDDLEENEINKPSIDIFDQPADDSSVSDLDSDDEEDLEVNYLKKIDDKMKQNILENYHPECIQKNIDEINYLCVTERDKNNIIIDKNHKTIPFLTKYEKCRAIGTRVKQLNSGAKPLVELKEVILDNYVIANRELREKKLPFIIQRPIANGKSEYWNINDLEFLE